MINFGEPMARTSFSCLQRSMSPSSLQGLDIIHPRQDTSTDSRDLLLDDPYPEFSAQLDLWNNLSFESDDPLAPERKERKSSLLLADEEEQEARSPVTEEKAIHDGHANVVTPANVNDSNHQHVHNPGSINPAVAVAAAASAPTAQPLDLNALLSSFSLDSFAAMAAAAAPNQHLPPLQQPQPNPQVIPPSLAQLLAFHSGIGYPPGLLPYSFPHVNPLSPPIPHNVPIASSSPEEFHGSAKRARTRTSSVTINSPEDGSVSSVTSPNTDASGTPILTPVSAAEDKRRRNTAASARFRLKKKEREVALETRAKELESKVVDLERECEALRRENGWLKGLVVGVTGASSQGPTASVPSPVSIGTKRKGTL